MKKYLWIVLFFVTTLCFAQPNAEINQASTDNNLVIQLVDSKLVNLDNKIAAVAQSNQDDVADLKARTDEKLADKFKQLDDKSIYVGWWLNVLGIWLTIIGLLAPLGAFLLNNKINKNIKDSQELLDKEIKKAVDQVKSKLLESDRLLAEMNGFHRKAEISASEIQDLAKKTSSGSLTPEDSQKLKNDSNDLKNIPENQLTANDWFIRGLDAANKQEYYEAISYCNAAIKLNPNDALFYNNRGNCKAALRQYEEAIKDYNKAIALDSSLAGLYSNRGNAKLKLQQYEEAIKDCDKAIELDHKFVAAYNYRGNAKHGLQRYDEAIKDFDTEIALDPNFADSYNCRGDAKAKLKQYDEAVKDYNKAIELDPKNVTAYFNKACAYALMKNKIEALKWLDKALQLAYPVNEVLKAEDWKIYLDDADFKNLIAKYNK